MNEKTNKQAKGDCCRHGCVQQKNRDLNVYQIATLGNTVTFSFILNSTGLSPSSSSFASASAFLSLSCNITVLATEAKVRFIGGEDKVGEFMSVFEEVGGSVGAIASKPAGAEADGESLENVGVLGMLEEHSEEETSAFPRGLEELEFSETVSDGDLAGDFVSTRWVEFLDLVAA